MLTSGSGPGATVSGSRIPVAKHRQTSPEHFTNHNNFPHSQQHNVSRPKYQINANNQHDSAVSSSGGSTGGSGESEGESSGINCKRRKDSSGSITGLHGMPGGTSCSPSRIPTAIAAKPSTPTTLVPTPTVQSGNATYSKFPSDSISPENSQLSSLPKSQPQVRTRTSKNNLNSNSPNVDNLTNNRKSSLQRPQSIDIEDEFNDKIRYARLTALQNTAESGIVQKTKESNNSMHTKENVKNKMAPLFSPSRKVLLDSNINQTIVSKSQSPSPSKIPIANDYFDSSASKNHKRSNISPPRKLTPPSLGSFPSGNTSMATDATFNKSECSSSSPSRHGSSENMLSRMDNAYIPTTTDNSVTNDNKFGAFPSGDKELRATYTYKIESGGALPLHTIKNVRSQQNGSTTEQNQINKKVPSNLETSNSKIPLPKIQNIRSRSASQSPSKHSAASSSSSPAASQSPTRGRSEIKTRLSEQNLSRSSRGSPTTPGLPTLGWSLQTEKQELRSEERIRKQLPESSSSQENMPTKVSPTLSTLQNMSCNNDNDMEVKPHEADSRIYDRNLEGYQLMLNDDIDTTYIDYEEDVNDTSESQSAKKKKFEAFMMTGDRMINLAKTPANNDFRSKHHKPSMEPIPLLEDECASLPSSPPPMLSPGCEMQQLEHNMSKKESEISDDARFSQLMDESGSDSNVVVKLRVQPQRNRSAVRTSKSEDQLMLLDGYQTSPDMDDYPGSVHTLLYETSVTPVADQQVSDFSQAPVPTFSSSTPRKRSPPRRQYSSESTESSPEKASQKPRISSQHPYHPQLNMTYTISPDISTSSLVSASEHYNGGSLVNDNVCSPQTSNSSPDTPEWSLIDSFHKYGKNGNESPSKKLLMTNLEKDEEDDNYDEPYNDLKEIDSEDSINSKGNKVIITIGNKGSSSPITDQTESSDIKLEANNRHLRNHNEAQRQASWAPLSSSPDCYKDDTIVELACKKQSPKAIASNSHQNGVHEDEEDVNYPYATPYSPEQENRNNRNYPYVPPPVFASPSHSVLPNDSRTDTNQQVDVEGSPSSLCSEESESDLESIHSYHPPAKVIDIPSAKRLATRLYYLDGFKKTDVSRHLSRNNEYNQVVADEYLKFFDLSGRTLDSSLRLFLCQFCLTGETQERERVLLHFSKRFLESNPEVLITEQSPAAWFRSQDSVHTLTCAIMLLNTDLHGENLLQRKMTCNEFIENLSELNDGTDFPRDLLRNIYYAIKQEPIPWAAATEEDLGTLIPTDLVQQASGMGGIQTSDITGISSASTATPQQHLSGQGQIFEDGKVALSNKNIESSNLPINSTNDIMLGKTGGGVNPFLSLPDPNSSTDYKKGYVMRKCCIDPNGKRTKLGKRSWKMFFLSLRDMVLYCFKEEKSLRLDGAFCDVNNAIRVHHGLAERASDYTKKQFVFRLHTADQAQYLFQTSDEKELLTWIDAINFVVASLSAPQLPPPCSSDFGRFQRPLMPSSKSTLSLSEQLVNHERQLMQLRRQIEDHLQSPPTRSAKGAQLHNFKEKREFLTFEIKRYETYILTLRTKSVLEDEASPRAAGYSTDAQYR